MGYNMTETKMAEIDQAIADGANEIDLVMNVSAFKSGLSWVKIEIAKAAKLAHENDCLFKVIIETALLSEEEKVLACQIVKKAGADFVKTSTGFSTAGATPEDVALMRRTVGPEMGVKAAGGIRSFEDAVLMIQAGATRLGASSGVAIVTGKTSGGQY